MAEIVRPSRRPRAKHIGIVACSAEGAALCYRTLCAEAPGHLGEDFHPEVTMHTYPLGEYMRFVRAGDWDGVARLMLGSVEKLVRVGAEVLICPDNTVHQAFDLVVRDSPVPWLHIAEVVAAEAVERGYRRVGVLGTRYLMEGPVYTSRLGARDLESCVPTEEERSRIDEIIFGELVKGRFIAAARAYFGGVIARLAERGCDSVALACTEIPLLVSQEDAVLPVLDSTRLLARAALRVATR